MGLKFDYVLLSDLPYNLCQSMSPETGHCGCANPWVPMNMSIQWAVTICILMSDSPQGIKLRLMEALHFEYAVDTYRFEPCLSILDVLMPNDVADSLPRGSPQFAIG